MACLSRWRYVPNFIPSLRVRSLPVFSISRLPLGDSPTFNEHPAVAGSVAILAAALSSVSTCLNSVDRASAYHATGNRLNGLRVRSREEREAVYVTDASPKYMASANDA